MHGTTLAAIQVSGVNLQTAINMSQNVELKKKSVCE